MQQRYNNLFLRAIMEVGVDPRAPAYSYALRERFFGKPPRANSAAPIEPLPELNPIDIRKAVDHLLFLTEPHPLTIQKAYTEAAHLIAYMGTSYSGPGTSFSGPEKMALSAVVESFHAWAQTHQFKLVV